MALDSTVLAETPEGLPLALRPAGVPPRLYAFLVDLTIRAIILIMAGAILGGENGLGTGLLLIVYFLVEWFYPVVFELSSGAATPGKRIFNLKVVMDTGLPVTPAASLVRNLLRAADFLPFAFAAGVLCMLCRRDFKRLGDVTAGTLVVYAGGDATKARLDALLPVEPLRPAGDLSGDAQRAIVNLALRAPRLTRERMEELAALVPARAAADPSASVGSARVQGLASWLVGHRT